MTKFLLIVAVLFGIPFYWLMIEPGGGAEPIPGITAASLHNAAISIPGSKPTSLRHYDYPGRPVPADWLSAGAGLRPVRVVSVSYVVAGPAGRVLVDAGGYAGLQPGALNDDQDLLVFTGTDVVTSGVTSRLDANRLAQRAILGPQQAVYLSRHYARTHRAAQDDPAWRLTKSPIEAIAPGVVLLRTPGQEAGSQMVYLEMADGRRIMIAGRTAPIERNWRSGPRPAARLVTDWLKPQVREQTARWLATVGLLERQGISIVPGIDEIFFKTWDCRKGLRDPGVVPRQDCGKDAPAED